jgi:hypothetical protein
MEPLLFCETDKGEALYFTEQSGEWLLWVVAPDEKYTVSHGDIVTLKGREPIRAALLVVASWVHCINDSNRDAARKFLEQGPDGKAFLKERGY